ncbi:MAG TPA: hypothetical protein VF627_03255 [Abditibacterium sp.]|jgi:hypothetical protein
MAQLNPLKIDQIALRFSQLLREAGTSLESPTLNATWQAFVAFCREPLECDDEKLFFEADLSSTQPDSFYVHFARTCYGRQPAGHVWSHEVIADFLFPLDAELEEFNVSFETEEFEDNPVEREEFIAQVQGEAALWQALAQREATQAQIYIGES